MRPFVLAFAFVAGCSDGATATVEGVDAAEDATTDVVDGGADTAVDSTTDTGSPSIDSGTDTRVDTGPLPDFGVGESGGTLFPCGTTTCSSSFQYCHRATSPGICPVVDSGVCPAGCPGCPALPVNCDTMPTKCWAKPSCACLLVEVCGSAIAGDCTEKDGGFTVGCKGV